MTKKQKLVNEVLNVLDGRKYPCLYGRNTKECTSHSSNRVFTCRCGCGTRVCPCTFHIEFINSSWKEVIPE